MSDQTTVRVGRILIADDEPTFLNATADFLRDEGYECDCAIDAAMAAEKLGENQYDLLISDIRMPGNPELELIDQVQEIARGMPVILVTGYPSVESATSAIELPVAAYLLKPLDFDELLSKVETCVQRAQAYRTIHNARQRLGEWRGELEQLETSLCDSVDKTSTGSAGAFVELTLRNVAGALADLSRLAKVLTRPGGGQEEAVAWMQLAAARNVVKEAIQVLESTKGAFKSKQLGQLRRKLQVVVDEWEQAEFPNP